MGAVRATVTVLAATVVLAAAATVGLRTPLSGIVDGFPPASSPDYARVPGTSFAPLRDAFVAAALGRDLTALAPEDHPPAVRATHDDPPRVSVHHPPIEVSHPLTNDDFGTAFPVAAVPFSASTDATRATREDGEPATCAPVGGTVWYRYTAASTRQLVANTFGTVHSTAVGVFVGSELRSLRSIACAADPAGNALVSFLAAANTTYHFQVASPLGGGPLTFALVPVGTIERVSVTDDGLQPSGPSASFLGVVSADARFVAFLSSGDEVAPGHRRGPPTCRNAAFAASECSQVFVRDRLRRRTTLASVARGGEAPNDTSGSFDLSADGRYVAFVSWATNLVPGDTNGIPDVFVHDRQTGGTSRVSVSSSGEQAEDRRPGNIVCAVPCDGALFTSMSADGRFVAFVSSAGNLVPGDGNDSGVPAGFDVFVHDRMTGATARVSVDREGGDPNADSLYFPSISRNGRFVAFTSSATDLVADPDGNAAPDVFLHDRWAGTTRLVSTSLEGGGTANAKSQIFYFGPAVSDDGRFVVFVSDASDLVPGDTNGATDVFLRDMAIGRTVRLSVSAKGEEAEYPVPATTGGAQGTADAAAITADGRYVVFTSTGTLVPDDTGEFRDVFVRDLQRGTITRVSTTVRGEQANGDSRNPSISADGRWIAFGSRATNLVEEPDDNLDWDVFLYEAPALR